MLTAGVDLASQPARTGLCVIAWDPMPRCVQLTVGADDAAIVAVAAAADRCGIDAPLGWPDDFVAAVAAHHTGQDPGIPVDTERLRLRATDVWVWKQHGRRPLSVSTDLIGVTALRGIRLQNLIAAHTGEAIDRSGAGRLAETYPAAALAAWGLPATGYKQRTPASRTRLAALAAAVTGRFEVAMPPAAAELACTSDDAFDALVCAIVARLAADGRTEPPPPHLAAIARREGWIHVPVAGT